MLGGLHNARRDPAGNKCAPAPIPQTVTLKGAVVGGKPKKAKDCGKALHPAAVPFDWSQDCRPGCGMSLKHTQC